MIGRGIALVAALAVAWSAASAPPDAPIDPRPYVVCSSNGAFYFKMSPDPADPDKLDNAAGYAFKVTAGSQDALLWSTSGWYAEQVFLALDGEHLVRMGLWPGGTHPSPTDLAVAFYASGQLVKSYSTADLIRNSKAVPRSESHYEYLGEPAPSFLKEPIAVNPDGPLTFRLVTSDRVEYIFDVRSGAISSSRQK